jgi:hypothetical protein
MKLFKNLRLYLILTILILTGILLIAEKYALLGVALIGLTLLIYVMWKFVVQSKDEKISGLSEEIKKTNRLITTLQNENNELRSRRLNLSELRNILDLGLLQVNASFTRTWNEKFEEDNKSIHFIGALQVKIVARYGVDLKELRIRYNRSKNEVEVANIHPRLLSFNDFDYEWKIAEVMEFTKPWFGYGEWRKSPLLEGIAGRKKEELRIQTHQEVKNGPEELEWVLDPLRKQIAGTIEILLGSPYRTVKMVDSFDETFYLFEEFSGFGESNVEKSLPEGNSGNVTQNRPGIV